MNRTLALPVAGTCLGAFVGSSMGVAAFGGAVNGAWVFGPLGAFVGWLVAGRLEKPMSSEHSTQSEQSPKLPDTDRFANAAASVFHAILLLLAYTWNFHISALKSLGILDTFVRRPLLFAGLCCVISLFFPPFLVAYFCCWLAASHFNASEDSLYFAKIP